MKTLSILFILLASIYSEASVVITNEDIDAVIAEGQVSHNEVLEAINETDIPNLFSK
jgi:hypothetical protein